MIAKAADLYTSFNFKRFPFQPNFVEKYSLGHSSIGSGPLSLETPLKLKNKRKRSSGKSEEEVSPAKKRKSSDGDNASSPSKEKKIRKLKDKEKTRKKSIENRKDAGSKTRKYRIGLSLFRVIRKDRETGSV